MADQIPVKIDLDVLNELEAEVDKVMHQDVPRSHAITWLWGEYKRLKREAAALTRKLQERAALPVAE